MTQKADKVRNAKFANKSFLTKLQKSGNGKTCTFCDFSFQNTLYFADLVFKTSLWTV